MFTESLAVPSKQKTDNLRVSSTNTKMSPDPTFAILSHKLEIFLFEEVKKTLIIFFFLLLKKWKICFNSKHTPHHIHHTIWYPANCIADFRKGLGFYLLFHLLVHITITLCTVPNKNQRKRNERSHRYLMRQARQPHWHKTSAFHT